MKNKNIHKTLNDLGPMTGAELLERTGIEGLQLWRHCMKDNDLMVYSVARHYMRLDRRVQGYARLSPSIYREFLTYTVIGATEQREQVEAKAAAISAHVKEVSKAKLSLAKSVISGLAAKLDSEFPLEERLCVLLAGDIVFDMAHDVPRPERSTGKLVSGSDMDLVVIVDDDFPEQLKNRIDEAIFAEKYRLLMTPHIREEIDYVVKDVRKVREQLKFDTFRHMVACKIMHEGRFLYGSRSLFELIKGLLEEEGIAQKLVGLEKQAWKFRKEAWTCLSSDWDEHRRHEILCLFYPTEESEEFE